MCSKRQRCTFLVVWINNRLSNNVNRISVIIYFALSSFYLSNKTCSLTLKCFIQLKYHVSKMNIQQLNFNMQ